MISSRTRASFFAVTAAMTLAACTGETIRTTTGQVYKDAKVVAVDDRGFTISHRTGDDAYILYGELSPDLQRKYGYVPGGFDRYAAPKYAKPQPAGAILARRPPETEELFSYAARDYSEPRYRTGEETIVRGYMKRDGSYVRTHKRRN